MGSFNRDYMQDDYESRGSSWGYDYPTTKWLMIASAIMYFLQFLVTERQVAAGLLPLSYIQEWLELDAHKVLHGQIWRLVTFIFCHDRMDPFSFVFHMVGLWYFGSILERMYGSREILWFYLVSGLFCGLIFTAFGLKLDLTRPYLGSAASVMALITLYATHFPTQEISFWGIIPIQIRVLLGIYVAWEVWRLMMAYSGVTPLESIAYLSVLWGCAFGFLYRRYDWHLAAIGDWVNLPSVMKSIKRARAARRLKVYAPEPASNLDEQVDAILAKIHEKGSESLTDRERSILQKASEKAKNRL